MTGAPHCSAPARCIVCSTRPATDAEIEALAGIAESIAARLRQWAADGVDTSVASGAAVVTPVGRVYDLRCEIRALGDGLERVRLGLFYGSVPR